MCIHCMYVVYVVNSAPVYTCAETVVNSNLHDTVTVCNCVLQLLKELQKREVKDWERV